MLARCRSAVCRKLKTSVALIAFAGGCSLVSNFATGPAGAEVRNIDLPSVGAQIDLPGLEDPRVQGLWREGIALEESGELLAASMRYQEIAEVLKTSASPYWRMARNAWRTGEALPTEFKAERIEHFLVADGFARRGIEIDDDCAECMLWRYASLGRLATTRGLITAARDASTMADLLNRGIELRPRHRDNRNNSTLANLYYASATFYRMVPDWFWLQWVIGVRGDKERAIRDARSAVALSSDRIDYQVELGAALLCLGDSKARPARTLEGITILRRAETLEPYLPTDPIDLKFAHLLIESPSKACGFSRDGFIDIDAAATRARPGGGA